MLCMCVCTVCVFVRAYVPVCALSARKNCFSICV